MPSAVNVGAATPLASVATAAVFSPPFPLNVPLAPLVGAVNVTVTPGTGFPPLSFTVACNGEAKAVVMVAFWGVPPVAVIVAGAPTVFVSENVAGVAIPVTVPVTL